MQSTQYAAGPLALSDGLAMRAATLVLIAICIVPVFTTPRGRLTSDESLYAAEALNVHTGAGPTYTTGNPVTHRAPLYPALLAAAFEVGGRTLDAGTWVPRIATVINAALAVLIARRLAGPIAGAATGVAAASSSYLNGLGVSLFLDQVQVSFVLASVLALAVANDRPRAGAYMLGGIALGLAVLTKESAIQLGPLPLVAFLLCGAPTNWRTCLIAWSAGLAIASAGWWLWVYYHTGAIYLLGDPDADTTRMAMVAASAAVLALVLLLLRGQTWVVKPPRLAQRLAGWALVVVWGAAFIAGLEWQSWEHPPRYWSDVPAYFADVLVPAMPAAPVMGAALLWAAGRTLRGDTGASVVTAAWLLYLPFVLVAANRELSLRDAAPVLYLGLVALGCGAAWLMSWGADLGYAHRTPFFAAAGAAVVSLALVAIAAQGFGRVERAQATSFDGDWDNLIAADTAKWLKTNLAPGTTVMSTRVYHSHVYFLAGGRFPIHQLPTLLVTVDLEADEPLRARSTLFRWEPLATRARKDWLYLARYPGKGYYIGLAEEDLLAEVRAREVAYVVVNAPDVGFSSPSYLLYFDAHPAFRRVHQSSYGGVDISVIYEVDRTRLTPIEAPLRVTAGALEGLLERAGGDLEVVERALGRLNGAGWEVVPQ
ncbi:MAG TPA: glycosyltransferase family 39 protein [Dehalococcoidia bacterium]|nr:glycosyltransferase family 39 protein [Dehalococcoidia bacterium]